MAERKDYKNDGVGVGGGRDRFEDRFAEDRDTFAVPPKRRPPSQRHEDKDTTDGWEEMKEN